MELVSLPETQLRGKLEPAAGVSQHSARLRRNEEAMFRFTAKSPISDEAGSWVERSMGRFVEVFGREALTTARVVLPTPEYFPDEGNTPAERAEAFLKRVCSYMDVDFGLVRLELFEDQVEELHNSLKGRMSHWESSRSGAAGVYRAKDQIDGHAVIAIKTKELSNPVRLVATLAHEAGHELLLAGGYVGRDEPDMEPLTDLVTVFRGLGIFTANSAFHFRQYSDGQRAGWSASRHGYLSEPILGYALAWFAHERRERKPAWIRYLKPNVAHYFKQSAHYMEAAGLRSR